MCKNWKWKIVWQHLIKLSILPSNSTPWHLPKEMKSYVHITTIYKCSKQQYPYSPKVKATQMNLLVNR